MCLFILPSIINISNQLLAFKKWVKFQLSRFSKKKKKKNQGTWQHWAHILSWEKNGLKLMEHMFSRHPQSPPLPNVLGVLFKPLCYLPNSDRLLSLWPLVYHFLAFGTFVCFILFLFLFCLFKGTAFYIVFVGMGLSRDHYSFFKTQLKCSSLGGLSQFSRADSTLTSVPLPPAPI